jgi:hypothetical protein
MWLGPVVSLCAAGPYFILLTQTRSVMCKQKQMIAYKLFRYQVSFLLLS